MTGNDVSRRVRNRADVEANIFDSQSMVDAINDTVVDFVRDTEITETQNTRDVDQDVASYDVPDDYVKMIDVFHDDRPIYPRTRMEIQRVNFTWRSDTGTPRGYIIEDGNTSVRLFPIPAEDLTDGLRFVYVRRPTQFTITNLGQEVDLPEMFHPTIVAGTLQHPSIKVSEWRNVEWAANVWAQGIARGREFRNRPDRRIRQSRTVRTPNNRQRYINPPDNYDFYPIGR